MYSIIDIETTGGNNKQGKITEIAAYLHDGFKLIDSFTTLINPTVPISSFITRLTGISDEMVANAPTFEEIATELDEFTANSIFVAHNVNFDYGFIREEFRNIGRDFKRKRLCTVQLSRKNFPGLPSYSLDKITHQLGITLDGHHRAAVDAKATVHLFEKILESQSTVGLFDAHFGIPDISYISSPYISTDFLKSIPDDTGVFRFFNRADELIYIKRSSEILSTICSKLKPNGTKDSSALVDALYRVDWEVTGSALVAQMVEANEVVSKQPEFNHKKFSMKAHFGLYLQGVGDDRSVVLLRRKGNVNPQMVFATFFDGLDYLKKAAHTVGLTVKEIGKGRRTVPTLLLNDKSLSDIFPNASYLIIDEATRVDERMILAVLNGQPYGYGLFDTDQQLSEVNEDSFPYKFANIPELEMVLRSYIAKGRYEKIVELKKGFWQE